ncbi:MAG TPA: sensor N-terminal transmembrane domain-containing protein, partial [Paracoccaceae bacterium]|nr:sensor N-terminal transmembrane domain-containing protein [Paracoccaceae bacterium]
MDGSRFSEEAEAGQKLRHAPRARPAPPWPAADPARGEAGIGLDDWREKWRSEPPAGFGQGRAFRARSPLARRIISFNVLALAALVAGILYLVEFDEGVLAERERGVLAEARVIAQGIARFARPGFGLPDPDQRDTNVAEAREFLLTLARSTANQIQVFDREGRLLADSLAAPVAELLARAGPDAVSGGLLGDMLRRIDGVLSHTAPAYARTLTPGLTTDPKVFRALDGRSAASRTRDAEGRLIVGVALPITRGRTVLGAVAVSTLPGEIEAVIAGQRAQVMQVFGVAVIISVALSLVLANTIVLPIRRLAEAAEQGEGRTSRLMNPQRIRIPDLTNRRDEIGYLSGAMRAMTTALYDRIEHIEVFAADVAHEIRNPLTSLRSAVETLRYAKTEAARER